MVSGEVGKVSVAAHLDPAIALIDFSSGELFKVEAVFLVSECLVKLRSRPVSLIRVVGIAVLAGGDFGRIPKAAGQLHGLHGGVCPAGCVGECIRIGSVIGGIESDSHCAGSGEIARCSDGDGTEEKLLLLLFRHDKAAEAATGRLVVERTVFTLHFQHPVQLIPDLSEKGRQSRCVFSVGAVVAVTEGLFSLVGVEKLCDSHGTGTHIAAVISGIMPAAADFFSAIFPIDGSRAGMTGAVRIDAGGL